MKRLLIIFLVLVSVSCVEKVIEKPKNLISKEKMVDILYDIAVFEAAKSTNKVIIESNDLEIMKLVYTNYETDSISFVESDLYYASMPLEYQSIYEAVEARLETNRLALEQERKRKTDSVRQHTKKRTDSLRATGKNIKSTSGTLP